MKTFKIIFFQQKKGRKKYFLLFPKTADHKVKLLLPTILLTTTNAMKFLLGCLEWASLGIPYFCLLALKYVHTQIKSPQHTEISVVMC